MKKTILYMKKLSYTLMKNKFISVAREINQTFFLK